MFSELQIATVKHNYQCYCYFLFSEQGVKDLKFLTELDLHDNRLNSLPVNLFQYLDDIRTLDLSFNNLGAFLMSKPLLLHNILWLSIIVTS